MIIFVGLAGSGKTIQGRLLAQKISADYMSAGELLRQNVDPAIKEKMLTGQLISDDDVIKVVDNALPRIEPVSKEFILDGFPRTVKQASWLIAEIKKGRFNARGVVHLVATEDVIIPRLLERSRPDDHMDAIKVRIDEYRQTILPLIEKFKDTGLKVYDINAEQPIETVQSEIISKLNLPVAN